MHISKVLAGAAAAALLMGPFAVFAAGGPSVTLSSTSAQSPSATWDNPIRVNVVVSTDTVNFNGGLVSASNGSVGNFSGSGSTYSFDVTPSHPSDTDSSHRLITVQVPDNAFEGSNPSNTLTFQYDASAKPADTTAPVITMSTDSQADGSTITTADSSVSTSTVHFGFTVDDASAAVKCSIGGQDQPDSFFPTGSGNCGSPQDYILPAGSYRFVVSASDSSNNTASSSRMFSIVQSATAPTTPAPTPTPAPATAPAASGGGGGGGGGGQIVGSSPTAPQSITGPGAFVNPNVQLVPTVQPAQGPITQAPTPAPTTPTVAKASTQRTTTVSASVPRTRSASTQSVAPAEPIVPAAEVAAPSAAPAPAADQNLQGAAVATTDSIPASTWIWAALALMVIAGLGWLFYRAA